MIETMKAKTPRVKKSASPKAESERSSETKLPRTFRRKSLEEAFIHFIQLSSPEQRSVREIESAAKKIRTEKIEFLANTSFDDSSSESEILGDVFLGTSSEEVVPKSSKTPVLPAHLARLCEAKLLTPKEEKSVFYRIDISDDQKESSMSEQRWHELRARLALMLDHLDRREKFIIRARFSLGGHRRIQTLQRLADKLRVSKERIRQLEKRALDKLRDMTDAITLPEPEM